MQLAWGNAALGDGQLVAQHQDLDVLGRGILARETSPREQVPGYQVDQLQDHGERSSHVARVIGTLTRRYALNLDQPDDLSLCRGPVRLATTVQWEHTG